MRMKFAKQDGNHKRSKLEADGLERLADRDGGLKDGSEYGMDELMRALSRNLGEEKLVEMLRILNMDGKVDVRESLHSRAQGIPEHTSIEMKAAEETGGLFMLTATKEEEKILVSAPGKKT